MPRPTLTRRTWAAAVVAALTLGLGACSSGSEPLGLSSATGSGATSSASAQPAATTATPTPPSGAHLTDDAAAQVAIRTAKADVVTLLSYDYRHLADFYSKIGQVVTGAFRTSYIRLAKTVVGPAAERDKISSKATVVGIGVGTFTSTGGTILVFIDQTTTTAGRHKQLSGSRVTLATSLVGGRWLIAGLDVGGVIDGAPAGTPGLGAALAITRKATVLLTTLTPETADSQVTRLLALASGAFKDSLAQIASQLTAAVEEQRTTTVGKIDGAAVASATGDRVEVLLAVTQSVKNAKTGSKSDQRYYRLKVTVAAQGANWLVDDMAFVQ